MVPTARANKVFTNAMAVWGGVTLPPGLIVVPNTRAHKVLAHRELGHLGRQFLERSHVLGLTFLPGAAGRECTLDNGATAFTCSF